MNFLEFLNFKEPNIVEYEKNGLKILYNKNKSEVCIFNQNEKWFTYSHNLKTSVWEMFSHYWIADGVCICTGLGFALRESWILTKRNVSKVIVLEKSKELIDYHQKNNPEICRKLEIINIDANQYIGKCDTLLLDHYENESLDEALECSCKILKNIECKRMWFWLLEDIILRENHLSENETLYESYNKVKLKYNTLKLPDLSDEELKLFIFASTYGLKCEWSDADHKNDYKTIVSGWYESWYDGKLPTHPQKIVLNT
jgi:hypothetical protein